MAMDGYELAEVAEMRRTFANGMAREIRVSLGVPLAEFASAAGVGKGTLSRYERGLRSPRPPEALRCKRVFGTLLAQPTPIGPPGAELGGRW